MHLLMYRLRRGAENAVSAHRDPSIGPVVVSFEALSHFYTRVLDEVGKGELRDHVDIVVVDATEKALELGNMIVANIILLGALSKRSGLISLDIMKAAVNKRMHPSMQAINIRALESGYDMV